MCEHSTLRKLSGNVCISFTDRQTRTLRKRSRSSCFFGKKIVFRQNAYLQPKYLSGFGDCYFAERTFGIKAKRLPALISLRIHFAERTFGIKAKREYRTGFFEFNFAERTFGIKAKRASQSVFCRRILPKELLESRQSEAEVREYAWVFCRKNFWNQGKASSRLKLMLLYFAERTFGIKAKQELMPVEFRRDFAERTFGIKAKR